MFLSWIESCKCCPVNSRRWTRQSTYRNFLDEFQDDVCLIDRELNEEKITFDRLTIMYFVVSSFDLLDELDKLKPSRVEIVEWIYGMQIQEGVLLSFLIRSQFY